MKTLILKTLGLAVVGSLALSGCQTDVQTSTPETSTKTEQNRASVSVKLALPQSTVSIGKSVKAALGTTDDIDHIDMTVQTYKSGIGYVDLATASFVNSDGTYQADVEDLPLNEYLNVQVNAYNSDNVEIFSGYAGKRLTSLSGEVIDIRMNSIDDKTAKILPKLNNISLSNETLTFNVGMEVNTTLIGTDLYYQIVSDDANFSFSPATGNIALGDGNITFDVNYTAPEYNTFTHSLLLSAANGNSVQTKFTTNILNNDAGSSVTLNFAPIINGIDFARTADTLSARARIVTDLDPSEYQLRWSTYGGDINIVDDTQRIVVMNNFQDEQLHVYLTITDNDGIYLSSFSTTLQADQLKEFTLSE